MHRLAVIALCLMLVLQVGCAVISIERVRSEDREEYTFSTLGIPLYHYSEEPAEDAPGR